MKKCSHKNCTEVNPQPFENFYKNKTIKDGHSIHCKVCTAFFNKKTFRARRDEHNRKCAEYRKKIALENPEILRQRSIAAHLKSKFGLTIDQWNKMFEAQGGLCKICHVKQEELKRRFNVDHCHKTGKIRALLCINCNTLLGSAMESEEILKNAIVYLNEHK